MTPQETVNSPKGTRDFYPEEMRVQNHIFDGWRKVCRLFGYAEYEGPTFEHLELYTGKSGEEIVGQLYAFKDKGDRNLALRPELTPTLARMINQKGPALRKPVKWFSIPRLYRYERMQKGRLREFFQLNMDIVGCETVAAEADLIGAVVEMLKGFGLGPADFSVMISSRALLSGFLGQLGVEEERKPSVYTALDKRSKAGAEEFQRMLGEAGFPVELASRLEAFFQCRGIPEVTALMGEDAVGLKELSALFRLLTDSGYAEYVSLDASVVRGLAYYTGIVFEVFDRSKSLRAIAGGGRYDNLLAKVGGQKLTGVGFGMGDVVLSDLLREKGLLPAERGGVEYFLADLMPAELPRKELLRLASGLRAKGRSVSYSLNGGKLKKQLAEADDLGAHKLIFFGSDRAPAGSFEVKDLASGEQIIVEESSL